MNILNIIHPSKIYSPEEYSELLNSDLKQEAEASFKLNNMKGIIIEINDPDKMTAEQIKSNAMDSQEMNCWLYLSP